jgi:hypothetical protein
LDLIELSSGTTGEAIASKLMDSLVELGLTVDVLQQRLMGFCTDGASNLLGSVKGALKLFADKIKRSDIFTCSFHCMNHKLELAVHGAVTSTNKVSHLRMFIDTLYAYYSRSPRNCRLLQSVSEELNIVFRKIGKIFDVRWLSSSYNSVDAVFKSLTALATQLDIASDDTQSLQKDRAKAKGMSKKLHSWSFISEIALMRDVLSILRDLSLYLQRRDASFIDAKAHLDSATQMLKSLKAVDGLSMAQVKSDLDSNGAYHGLVITHTEDEQHSFAQLRGQFIQALLDNLSSRFPAKEMLDAGAALNPASWPDNEDEKIFFGDKEVMKLAEVCHIDKREAVSDFRLYKNNIKLVNSALSSLFQRVKLLPISSAECERGFSCMNMNNTPDRNRLTVTSLCALIFIKVNGPRPIHFNPLPYVEQWLKDGRHGSSDLPTGKPKKSVLSESSMATIFA